jgi:hypothetical protein
VTLCRLHFLDACTNPACVKDEEPETLTGSAVPLYDETVASLVAATGWCNSTEEAQIWAGTGTE